MSEEIEQLISKVRKLLKDDSVAVERFLFINFELLKVDADGWINWTGLCAT